VTHVGYSRRPVVAAPHSLDLPQRHRSAIDIF
jgi:hypothetical protein